MSPKCGKWGRPFHSRTYPSQQAGLIAGAPNNVGPSPEDGARIGVPASSRPRYLSCIEVLLELVQAALRRLGRAIARVEIDHDGVMVRSGRGRRRHFPLERVERFEWHQQPEGGYCVLLLAEGGEVPVRSVAEERRGDVTALNNRLKDVRRGIGP